MYTWTCAHTCTHTHTHTHTHIYKCIHSHKQIQNAHIHSDTHTTSHKAHYVCESPHLLLSLSKATSSCRGWMMSTKFWGKRPSLSPTLPTSHWSSTRRNSSTVSPSWTTCNPESIRQWMEGPMIRQKSKHTHKRIIMYYDVLQSVDNCADAAATSAWLAVMKTPPPPHPHLLKREKAGSALVHNNDDKNVKKQIKFVVVQTVPSGTFLTHSSE